MGPFNNRELAIAFWLLVFAVVVLWKPDGRKALGGFFQVFCCTKILVPVCLMLFYVVGIVALLAILGIWTVDLLKDTITWFFIGAMAMMVRFGAADKKDNVFRRIIKDSIKTVIVLEFLVNTYTFPLIVELIVVPLVCLIAMADAFASAKEENTSVAKVTKGAQIAIGLVVLGVAISRAIVDMQNLASLSTLRSVILIPLLSVLMFPFIYVMLVFSQYEFVFLRLELGPKKTQELKRYARRRIMMYAGLSLRRLQYLLKNHTVDLMYIESESEIDRFLQQARDVRVSTTETSRCGTTRKDE